MKSFLLFSVWYFLFPASVHWYLFTLILTYITVLPIPFVITSWVYSRHWCSEEMLTFNCFQSFICFNFWCLMNGFLSKSYFVTLWKETKLCKKEKKIKNLEPRMIHLVIFGIKFKKSAVMFKISTLKFVKMQS